MLPKVVLSKCIFDILAPVKSDNRLFALIVK